MQKPTIAFQNKNLYVENDTTRNKMTRKPTSAGRTTATIIITAAALTSMVVMVTRREKKYENTSEPHKRSIRLAIFMVIRVK